MKPTSIVCAIDLLLPNEPALAFAMGLARVHGARLHVLHVRRGRSRIGTPDPDGTGDPLRTRLDAAIEAAHPRDVQVVPVIVAGSPLTAIVEYVRRTAADLVVVARDGSPRSRYWPRGAFAAALGPTLDCPTIVVPVNNQGAPSAAADLRNILAAVDFSYASVRALRQALQMAQQIGGRLTLLHVLEGFVGDSSYSGGPLLRHLDGYRATTQRIDAELGLLVPPDALDWCEVRCETISGLPHLAIPARATALGADLIVLGLPGRARVERLIEGSTARGVLRRADCPVLMVPGPPGLTAGISETIVPHLAAGAWPLPAERRVSVHAPARVLQERHEVAELMRRELLPVSARHQGDGARLYVGN